MCAATSSNWATVSPDLHYDIYLPAIGLERTANMYKINSLMRAGVNASYHSDYYVSVPEIGNELFSAVTRSYPQKQFDDWYADTDMKLSDIRKSRRKGISAHRCRPMMK